MSTIDAFTRKTKHHLTLMELINCQKKVITIDGQPYTFLKKAYGKFDLQPLINLKLSSALNIYAQ